MPSKTSKYMPMIRRSAVALASVLAFGLALWVIHRSLSEYDLHDIAHVLHHIPVSAALLAGLASLLSYAALTGFDGMAVRYVGKTLPFGQVALASFIAQAISHSTGFAALTGTSLRYRFYSNAGISGGDVARIVAFCGLTFGLGAVVTVAGAMLLEPRPVGLALGLHGPALRVVGLAILCGVGFYVAATLRQQRSVKLWRWIIPLPGWKMTAGQIALAVADMALAAAALYVLLPQHGTPGFPAFLGLYAVAILAGVISHVPGGLGVFEGLLLLMLPQIHPASLLGAMVLYRFIYNLIPLIIAAGLLGAYEIWQRGRVVAATARWLSDTLTALAPALFSVLALGGGAMLLWSAALPAHPKRLAAMAEWLPLSVVEASHLLGSVVGVWLLLLARGLYRRLDGAYWLTCVLYGAGIVFSLLRGFYWEEAVFLALLLAIMAPAHRAFYRKAALIEQRFTFGWAAAVVVIVASTVWLGGFAFKHAAFSREMWWDFAFASNAPRTLRAVVAAVVVAGLWFLARLIAPARFRAKPTSAEEIEMAGAVALASSSAEAQLAWLGDKNFLFDAKGEAFLMYAVSGRSWVAMGDPVGPKTAWPDLIWRFREMVDRVSGWPVFYQVSDEALPLYLDLGLSFVKLGEEARVPLEGFSLQGSARSELRYVHKRAQKDGASFEVLPPEAVLAVMADLEAISDSWLHDKSTKEKRFSLGAFKPDYIRHFHVGVVRREGKIVAFSNLWLSGDKNEIAVDLMRHSSEAGYGIMDYLFIESMLWGQAQGYRWFSFGVAPLSGMRDDALAPLWNRVGAFLYRHGEDLYNFQGLRKYKEKFQPEWSPRYMVSPGGLALPAVAADVATLISGGVRGLVMK